MGPRTVPILLSLVTILLASVAATEPGADKAWLQWAQNPQHTGFIQITSQPPNSKLAEITYDPFVRGEQREDFGELLTHYQVPLTEGNSAYMEFKTGKWILCHPRYAWLKGAACGPNTWDQEIWNEKRLDWQHGKLVETWTFQSDWKPEPNGYPRGLFGWEPVFHPVLTHHFLYVPGFAGTIWKVDKSSGKAISRINPFGGAVDSHRFVSSPLSADSQGNVYYNVMKMTTKNPWGKDVSGAWLVKISPDDTAAVATYKDLVPGAPDPKSHCPFVFTDGKTLPWPPSRHAKPQPIICGSQRPGLNVAPAIAQDGTIYTISVAHLDPMAGYLVAVNPDLTPKWQASLQKRFHDGCGFIVPIAKYKNQPNACRGGANPGVDPTTNDWGSGWVGDQGSSSPTVLPDGSILMGVVTDYNGSRGHLMKFSSAGDFLASYDFGWDETPAVYSHDGTYPIVIKDNHYGVPLYCAFNSPICQPLPPGPFDITQLSADLKPEWKFKNTTIDGQHPNGYEWCINAPVIGADGLVHVNSEDGNLYVLNQGGTLKHKIFLKHAEAAAYTPLSLGPDGKIYTQNDGVLFVLGK